MANKWKNDSKVKRNLSSKHLEAIKTVPRDAILRILDHYPGYLSSLRSENRMYIIKKLING